MKCGVKVLAGLAGFVAASPAVGQIRTDCVATVGHGVYVLNAQQICAASTSQGASVVDLSMLNQLNAQTQQLGLILTALQELTAANEAFRKAFEKKVAEQQQAMRDDVVAQLTAIPGAVAANPEVVRSITLSVATQLAADPAFAASVAQLAQSNSVNGGQ